MEEKGMSVLNKIAYFRNRRDEVPNQELACELAGAKDIAGIREIAEALTHKNKNVRSDCLKVLYEVGYLDPELISDYAGEFLTLLHSKENRMVWGGMIALGTIAGIVPSRLWEKIDDIIQAVEQGSLITVVWGVKTLARVAAADKQYNVKIFPVLIQQMKRCIPRDLPLHAESVLCAVNAENQNEFLSVLRERQTELTPAQAARLKKTLKALQK
jgi:hypothetical protein